jgi:hypothetical protein
MAALWGISGFRSDARDLAANGGNVAFAERAEAAIQFRRGKDCEG